MTVLEFDDYSKKVFNKSINRFAEDENSNFYRLICFEHMDSNEMNIAFNSEMVDYVGNFQNPLYHPKHIVDGSHYSNITLGSCTVLMKLNTDEPKITIHFKGKHIIKKVILWPTNQQTTQQLQIYMHTSHNTCSDNDIFLDNNSPTTVLCNNLKQTRSSNLTVQPTQQNDILQLCEIEIISNNIAYLKGVINKYAHRKLSTLTDGLTNINRELKIGGQFWVAINLFAYYNVLAIDLILSNNFHLSYQFVIEVTNENPYLSYNSSKYSLCGEYPHNAVGYSSYPEKFISFLCPSRGVKGQFVVFRRKTTNSLLFRIREVEVFGNYIKQSNNENTNILLHKPVWTSSSFGSIYTPQSLTDGLYNIFYHSKVSSKQWARVDTFTKYTIFRMAILNRDENLHDRARYINGLVSNYQDFNIEEYHSYSEKCFTNNEDFLSGEYRLWECETPFPVGRFAIIFLNSASAINILELEAYGQEIVDNDMVLLPVTNIDRSNDAKSIQNGDESDQYPIKIIDSLAFNALNDGFLSCSGNLASSSFEEGRITLYMDNQYLINQIGVLIPFEAPKENFKNIQVTVELFFFDKNLQKSICSNLTNNFKIKQLLYKCEYIGDRVSLYKFGGNGLMQLCEIYIFGRKQFVDNDKSIRSFANVIYSLDTWTIYSNSICDSFYPTQYYFIELPVYCKITAIGFLLRENVDFQSNLNIFALSYGIEILCTTLDMHHLRVDKPTNFTFHCKQEMITKYLRISSEIKMNITCDYYVISKEVIGIIPVKYQLKYEKKMIKQPYIYSTIRQIQNVIECYKICKMDREVCQSLVYFETLRQCNLSSFPIFANSNQYLLESSDNYYSILYKIDKNLLQLC
ncbi:DgyrCDS14749 [Dimorphilus gyrociliatus]|uniref:DgyrCDS14749 n=1 Tax=Dimorphilus gyrociliatus TaxID=2664684 RepID=A0A7I8WEP4_9ANNE|nr:DgyrCDS14749 [Dimorphilus gyrociliatus]